MTDRERRERRDRTVELWRSGAATAEQVASDLNNQLSASLAALDRLTAERDSLAAKITAVEAENGRFRAALQQIAEENGSGWLILPDYRPEPGHWADIAIAALSAGSGDTKEEQG